MEKFKTCCKCKRELPADLIHFQKVSKNKDGLCYTCKECLGYQFKKRKIDMIGKRFERLVVLKENGKTKKGEIKYLCQCDCGTLVTRVGYGLRHGLAVSCGCKKIDTMLNLNKTHGMTGTRIYRIWKLMLSRCFNKNVPAYHNYGGRGIVVCNEWRHDFINFYNWSMVNGYKENLSIDRINNNDIYKPNNCKWATMDEQANNKRSNVKVSFGGKYITLRQLSNETGITYSALTHRYYRHHPLIISTDILTTSGITDKE